MKKLSIIFLSALTMILFTACGGSAEKTSAPEKPSEPEKPADKILVAYFSCTGHTKTAAMEVAELLNAETFEIVPAQAYTPADLDYNIEDCRANLEQKDSAARPAIKNKLENSAQYKTIVLAFPI